MHECVFRFCVSFPKGILYAKPPPLPCHTTSGRRIFSFGSDGWSAKWVSTAWMSQEVSKGLVSGLEPQYTPFISMWNNPLILTIDPNFLPGTSKYPRRLSVVDISQIAGQLVNQLWSKNLTLNVKLRPSLQKKQLKMKLRLGLSEDVH